MHVFATNCLLYALVPVTYRLKLYMLLDSIWFCMYNKLKDALCISFSSVLLLFKTSHKMLWVMHCCCLNWKKKKECSSALCSPAWGIKFNVWRCCYFFFTQHLIFFWCWLLQLGKRKLWRSFPALLLDHFAPLFSAKHLSTTWSLGLEGASPLKSWR